MPLSQKQATSAAKNQQRRIRRRQGRSFGPVLSFRGADDTHWRVAALTGIPSDREPGPLTTGEQRVQPRRIAGRESIAVWRYDVALPRAEQATEASYGIGDDRWLVHVPGHERFHVAFTSCNGTEEAPLDVERPERNERWRHLWRVNERDRFHLLIQGGDQYYADLVWKMVPDISKLRGWFGWKQRRASLSDALAEALEDFYFQRYTMLWSQRELRGILATVPSLMMWDDHDIFDGWGSHPTARQDSNLHQGIYHAARNSFEIFQLAKAINEPIPGLLSSRADHFSWCYRVGPVGILAPDLRATRRFKRVMSDAEWRDVECALENLRGCRVLLLVSTVPLVSADVSPIEPIFLHVPGLLKQHNDLRDQWQSYMHRDAWTRMLSMLFAFAEANDATVLLLSGEIHMGQFGRARRGGRTLWQLTSSGVVNTPPSPLLKLGFEWLSRRPVSLPGGIQCQVLPLFDGDRYLRARNWLELEFAGTDVRRIAWHAEKRREPITLDLSAWLDQDRLGRNRSEA